MFLIKTRKVKNGRKKAFLCGEMWRFGGALRIPCGGWDTSLQFLIGIMAVDYSLGILIAMVWHKSPKSKDGTFESNVSLKGLLRKFSVLLIVYVAVQLDTVANTGGYLRTANEGFSIIENFGIMGVPMPEQVIDAFAAIKSKSEKTE